MHLVCELCNVDLPRKLSSASQPSAVRIRAWSGVNTADGSDWGLRVERTRADGEVRHREGQAGHAEEAAEHSERRAEDGVT